jgi:hypothetical protein
VSIDRSTSCSGVFAAASADGVTLVIDPDAEEVCFESLSRCLVSFADMNGINAFFAQVRALEHEQDSEKAALLQLLLPSQILSTECRSVFRVPVVPDHDLHVQLTTGDGRTWPVAPVDISMGGILISFPVGEDPGLGIGAQLTVQLCLGKEAMSLAGTVCHRRSRHYGLFFRDTLRRGEIVPCASLRAIVKQLETHWLQRRTS